jgi:hypothetical protein
MTPFGIAWDKFRSERLPREGGYAYDLALAAFHRGWGECAKLARDDPKVFAVPAVSEDASL